MLDFAIVGPIVGIFAISDILLHLNLDFKKAKMNTQAHFQEPPFHVSSHAMALVVFSTLLSFLLVLLISIIWLIPDGTSIAGFFLLIPYDFPYLVGVIGLILLISGITLHSWARFVRHEMASSWAMKETQTLITSGPYSRVRHPSYTSYIISFIGLFLMLPSVVTGLLFFGIWGYYEATKAEEANLLHQFGDAYSDYMKRTGRLFPKFL